MTEELSNSTDSFQHDSDAFFGVTPEDGIVGSISKDTIRDMGGRAIHQSAESLDTSKRDDGIQPEIRVTGNGRIVIDRSHMRT
jgi:hypothetical protein